MLKESPKEAVLSEVQYSYDQYIEAKILMKDRYERFIQTCKDAREEGATQAEISLYCCDGMGNILSRQRVAQFLSEK